MIRPHVLGFLAITLCLVACLCARAGVSEQEAEVAVRDVNQSTANALRDAEEGLTEATNIKQAVEERNKKAKKAVFQAINVTGGNVEASAFVEKAKTAWQKCLTAHIDAKNKTEKAFNALQNLSTKAEELVEKAEIDITPDTNSPDDYTQVNESAAAVKRATEELNNEIQEALTLLNAAKAAYETLSGHARDILVATSQVHAIVRAAEIDTMLTNADTAVQIIKEKKDEVNATVTAVSQLLENAPENITSRLDELLTNTENELSAISAKVNEAQDVKQGMTEMKRQAEQALKNIKNATVEDSASQILDSIDQLGKQAAEDLETIQKAVTSVKKSAGKANLWRQQAVNALSQGGSGPDNELDEDAKKKGQTVEDVTTPTNSEDKPAQKENEQSETSEDVMTLPNSEDKPAQKENEQSEASEDVTTLPNSEDKPAQKENEQSETSEDVTTLPNSEDKPAQKENEQSKTSEDVTAPPKGEDKPTQKDTEPGPPVEEGRKSAVNKGKLPSSGTNDDSAVTVSFSVLVAFISFTVLQ